MFRINLVSKGEIYMVKNRLTLVKIVDSLKRIITSYRLFLIYLFILSLSILAQEKVFASLARDDFQSDQRVRRLLPSPQKTKDSLWILSIDGGGIRGLIPAYLLQYIEERVEHEVRQNIKQKILRDLGHEIQASLLPACPIHLAHCFDVMAGTSTGGIISLGLNVPQQSIENSNNSKPLPKYKASDLVKLYQEKGNIIFADPNSFALNLTTTKFKAKPIEELFAKDFGNTKISQLISTTLVTAYEMRQEQLLVLDSSLARNFKDQDFYVKDAARATSAAPTKFKAAEIKNLSEQPFHFADGGLIANNPSLVAYHRAKALYPGVKKIILLSLGTGASTIDDLVDLGDAGLLQWAPKVASVMMKGASDLNHFLLQQESSNLGKDVFDYIRIQVPVSKKRKAMDDVSPNNLNYLLQLAKKEAQSSRPLQHFIELLAENIVGHFSPFPDLTESINHQLQKGNKITLTFDREFKEIDELKAWTIVNAIKASTRFITSFEFDSIKISSKALKYLLKDRVLQHLTLKGADITKEEIEMLKAIGLKLFSLNISKNTRVGDDGINLLTKNYFPELQYLNVFNTNLSDQSVLYIAQNLPTLTGLEIGGNSLTPRGVNYLLSHMRNLKHLNLSRSDGSFEVIEALKRGLSLTSLDLSHNRIDDFLLNSLLTAINGKSLASLTLTVNELTEKSGSLLEKFLQSDRSLTFLDLSNNNLSNGGVKSILRALRNNKSLRVLKLSRNFIGEQGIYDLPETLKINSTLSELCLTHNEDSLSSRGLEILKRASQVRRVFKLDY